MRISRAAFAPCGRMKWRSAKDSNLGHHCWCDCFQDSVLGQPDALRCEMAPPLGIAPSSHRLTGGPHTLCVERNLVLPAGFSPACSRLEGGCLIRSATGAEMVARLGAAPSVSSSQARRIAVFLARDVEIGGLCGHCSRDLPLDRRLLFVAELTGQDGAVSG